MGDSHDYVTLGELAELNPESLGPRTPADSTFNYIDLSSVSHGSIDMASVERLRFADAPSRARRVVRDGDVLFGTVRPQLRSHVRVMGDDFIASTGFCVIRARPDVASGGFLGHYLLSDDANRQAACREVGSNYPAVTERDVTAFRLPRVSLEEQRRIAEILDTIDETIQATERVIAKRKRIRAGLAASLLSGRSEGVPTADWKTNETPPPLASTSPSRSWDMAKWRVCRLGDLGAVVGGGTPSRERAEYWGGHIPWLTPRELTGNTKKSVSETQDCITELGLAASGARLLAEGSLLITSRASIGSCALAGKPMATNQGFKNLTPGVEVDPSFLFYLGRTLGREMTRRASGTTFLEISGREFGRIAVRLPPLEEQRQIAEILDNIDETIQVEEVQGDKLRQLRSGLAADLLSGRVRTVAV